MFPVTKIRILNSLPAFGKVNAIPGSEVEVEEAVLYVPAITGVIVIMLISAL